MLGINIIKKRHNSILSKPTSRVLTKASSRAHEQKLSNVKSNYRHNRLNQNIMQQRKQQMLNAMFITRKNNLKKITQQNKQIYKRINSQKSLYSSRSRSQSRQSRCNSRMSCNSSKSSLRKVTPKQNQTNLRFRNKTAMKKENVAINIEANSINKLKEEQLIKFRSLFCSIADEKQTQSKKQHQRKKSENLLQKSRQNNCLKPVQNRNTVTYLQKQSINKLPVGFDGLLHRIAQQLYSKKKQPIKKTKRLLH